MTSSIDNVRALAAKNAALSNHAARAQEHIFAAAESECAKLTALIESVKLADALCDDAKAKQYQTWVIQRAGLMRLLAGRDSVES
jgi:hypothetical protein